MGAMKTLMAVTTVVLAGLAAMPPAQAQGKATYEPAQRARVGGLDNCMKDEVMNGAFCVKQCAAGFKLQVSGRSATCTAEAAGAKVPPPKPPEFVTPDKRVEPTAKGS